MGRKLIKKRPAICNGTFSFLRYCPQSKPSSAPWGVYLGATSASQKSGRDPHLPGELRFQFFAPN